MIDEASLILQKILQAMEIVLNDEINEQQKHKPACNVAVIDELDPFEQCRLPLGQKSPLPSV